MKMGALRRAFFMKFWFFCRKWQTAFGQRLRSRIRVRASCFQPLSLHWGPLFFQWSFNVFWGTPGALFHEVGKVCGRACIQLFDFKNKALVTCTSIPCFRSATGLSTGSLVGSSLEPAAGFKGPASAANFCFCILASIIQGA